MRRKTLPRLRQVLGGGLTQGLLARGRGRRVGQPCPGALAWPRPLRVPLVARGPQQTATRLTQVAFQLVVGPRQARDLLAVAQTGPIAPTAQVEMTAKRRDGRCPLWRPRPRSESAASWPRDRCSMAGGRGQGGAAVGQGMAPGGALVSGLGGSRPRGRMPPGDLGTPGRDAGHRAWRASRDSHRRCGSAARRAPGQPDDRAAGLCACARNVCGTRAA